MDDTEPGLNHAQGLGKDMALASNS